MGNLVCRRHGGGGGGGGGAVVVVVAPAFVNIHQCLHPSIHPYRQADLTCVPLHTCYVHLLKKYKYLHPVHHSSTLQYHYSTLHYITAQCIHTSNILTSTQSFTDQQHLHILRCPREVLLDYLWPSVYWMPWNWREKRLLQPMSLWRHVTVVGREFIAVGRWRTRPRYHLTASLLVTRWWQLKYVLFSLDILGNMFPFWRIFFCRWVGEKPPTRLELLVSLGRYSYLLSCFFVFLMVGRLGIWWRDWKEILEKYLLL